MKKQLLLLTLITLCVPTVFAQSEAMKPHVLKRVELKKEEPIRIVPVDSMHKEIVGMLQVLEGHKPVSEQEKEALNSAKNALKMVPKDGNIHQYQMIARNYLDRTISTLQTQAKSITDRSAFMKAESIIREATLTAHPLRGKPNAEMLKKFHAKIMQLHEITNKKPVTTQPVGPQPTNSHAQDLEGMIDILKKMDPKNITERSLKMRMHVGFSSMKKSFKIGAYQNLIKEYTTYRINRLDSDIRGIKDQEKAHTARQLHAEAKEVAAHLTRAPHAQSFKKFHETIASITELISQGQVLRPGLVTTMAKPVPGKPVTEATNKQYELKINSLSEQLAKVQAELARVKAESSSTNPNIESIRAQYASKIKELNTKLENAHKDIKNKSAEHEKMMSQNKELNKKIEALNKLIASMKKEVTIQPVRPKPEPKPKPQPTIQPVKPQPKPKKPVTTQPVRPQPKPFEQKPEQPKEQSEGYGLTGPALEVFKLGKKAEELRRSPMVTQAVSTYRAAIKTAQGEFRKNRDRQAYKNAVNTARTNYRKALDPYQKALNDVSKVKDLDRRSISFARAAGQITYYLDNNINPEAHARYKSKLDAYVKYLKRSK